MGFIQFFKTFFAGQLCTPHPAAVLRPLIQAAHVLIRAVLLDVCTSVIYW
jgi:hypothetical protein